MIDDPANALADILEGWAFVEAGHSLEDSRDLGNPEDSTEFWAFHARVFDLIREVERAIVLVESRRPATHFRRHIPAIYAAVCGYTVPFRSTASYRTAVIDRAVIDSLRSLGDVLQSMDAFVENDAAGRQRVEKSIQAVRDLLADVEDRESRAYLTALVAELEQAIADVDTFGTALVRRLSNELAAVLIQQGAKESVRGEKQKSARFFNVARDLILVGATSAVTKVIDVGVDQAIAQITS
ncbi:hypothetical protein CBF90_02070 [Microbacterium sp. AISO3]|uniref:hypothetical protein n=1 Tax=Microbacterium sp. AISO3 TaxID=2002831 RepID=UPI000B4D8369|nr:hypothetical protein [Microbacterium sp. AISO3]OWP20312.1 hypothetical protein CBF90_17175 [Microbacterium sp. AISO3]OWP23535.1 hypothetical protein CBF90_02070 [Microbacterium sp. AISO3]